MSLLIQPRYIKFLPDELLPTFWTEEEQETLTGTTLRAAVRAKLNNLLREYEKVRTATESIGWCAKYWWDENNGLVSLRHTNHASVGPLLFFVSTRCLTFTDVLLRKLTFDDWMCVDAMYRSRALEFPGVGDAMVPAIDMANHASGDATAALYETDGNGNGVLLLRDGKIIPKGGEITITSV